MSFPGIIIRDVSLDVLRHYFASESLDHQESLGYAIDKIRINAILRTLLNLNHSSLEPCLSAIEAIIEKTESQNKKPLAEEQKNKNDAIKSQTKEIYRQILKPLPTGTVSTDNKIGEIQS